jgi:hypothetical protein
MPQYKMHVVRVVVEHDAVVIVEVGDDPMAVARAHIEDIAIGPPDRQSATYLKPIETLSDIPKKWRDSLPWGDSPVDISAKQWLKDEEYATGDSDA